VSRLAWTIAVIVACGACACQGKGEKPNGQSAPEQAAAPAASSAAAPAPAAWSATPAGGGAWSGSYRATAGTLYIPPEWKDVRWKAADSGAGIGEGTLAIAIDAATGRLTGTLDGPLGPALIDGVAKDGQLAATLVRKSPEDRGFTGTLLGTVEGDHVSGTMNLSSAEASSIRTADFRLTSAGR
jgi:hypothetical protein